MARQASQRVVVDLLVIGGGPAGLAAARAGRALGARTLLVSEHPFGSSQWIGGLPGPVLAAGAADGRTFADAVAQLRQVRSRVAARGDQAALRAEGIDARLGLARFLGGTGTMIEVLLEPPAEPRGHAAGPNGTGGVVVRAYRVVIATGSSFAAPGIAGLDEVAYLTSRNAFELVEAPRSLAVVGGGPTGTEIAQTLARLGAKVTLLEARPTLLPGEDPAVGAVLRDALERDGVRVLTGTRASSLAAAADGGSVVGTAVGTEAGAEVLASHVLVATGARPRTAGLAPDAVGVLLDGNGAVRVDRSLRTSNPAIYAAGDVTALARQAHAAQAMGRLAAANALATGMRRTAPWSGRAVPRVVFTDPEVASVGLSEAQAARRRGARVHELPMAELDRAVLAGRTEGFAKVITAPAPLARRLQRPGDQLLGAVLVGPSAGETIVEFAVAVQTGLPVARLAGLTHPYPTWSGGVLEALSRSRGRPARS
jgi:pyruvate/2-oxoglutarate dehydrogenase complex dihydrolipoamide dehydrogenase (E3) component